MRTRIIAAVVAAVLAVVGAVFLINYVNSADQRAVAGLTPTPVLVVVATIPKGTPASALGTLVEVRQVPRSAVATGAVANVAALQGRVASIELLPGEQVLANRFVDPNAAAAQDLIQFPPNLQQLTISVAPERVIGGRVKAGDTVGIVITTDNKTNFLLNRAIVTRVVGGVATSTTSDGTAEKPASAQVVLTLAVSALEAEKIVWAVDNARVYLTLQRPTTSLDGTRIVDAGSIYA